MSRYAVNEADAAVLIALAAILNADIEGMKANGRYTEGDIFNASQELRDYLETLKEVAP